MASLNNSVNSLLKQMSNTGGTDKGSFGEKAVLRICEGLYQEKGGILIHSYAYKTDKQREGNVKINDSGKLYIENLGEFTEIDILYVTKYRVFPIEVKAYKAKEIVLTDDKISGCYITNKSPIHQNEMHCRHLYSHIFRILNNGNINYIVPIVCFVDDATIIDNRTEWQKKYIKLSILDNIEEVILSNNTLLDCPINLTVMDNILKEAMVSNEKYLPVRY